MNPAPTLKGDLTFGTNSERSNQSKLEGFFKRKLTRAGGYSTFDFNDGATLFVELKTRRIPHDRYKTAIIGANKVETAAQNPDRSYWFCYAYEDGIYGIEFQKDLFATFERSEYSRGDREDYHNRPQTCVFIPSHLLTKIF